MRRVLAKGTKVVFKTVDTNGEYTIKTGAICNYNETLNMYQIKDLNGTVHERAQANLCHHLEVPQRYRALKI